MLYEVITIQYELTRVDTEKDFLECIKTRPWDIIISDYQLPSFDGRSALKQSGEILKIV